MEKEKVLKKRLKVEDLEKIAKKENEFTVENIEEILNNQKEEVKEDHFFLTLPNPFKLCVVGKSNSGKSVMVLNLLAKYLNYDTLTICGETAELQAKYNLFYDLSILFPNKFRFVKKVSNIRLNKFDKKKINIVVIDDAQELGNKDQQIFIELYTKGRHYGVNPIYIAQNFFKVNPRIRANSSTIVMFRTSSKREIQTLHNSVAGELDKDFFFHIFKEATEPENEESDFPFLVIDLTAKTSNIRYRKNFNQILIADPE